MTDRVIWLAGWTLLVAVVGALLAILTLAFAWVTEPVSGARAGWVECRPFDVMMGRNDDCAGWPSGAAMPMLLAVAAVATWGIPERRRGNAVARLIGSLATVVVGLVAVVVVANLDFSPRAPTMRLLWLVVLSGLAPLVLLPFALRHDLHQEQGQDPADVTQT